MKKIKFWAMALVLSLAIYPVHMIAAAPAKATQSTILITEPDVAAQSKVLELRLQQIDKMDKSALNHSEKKALRKEVRSIKEQLAANGGYIYISVGAAIIIVLLLIILL